MLLRGISIENYLFKADTFKDDFYRLIQLFIVIVGISFLSEKESFSLFETDRKIFIWVL